MLSATSAIVSLIALIVIFRAFGSNMQEFYRILMMSLMWHKDQKSVCALVLAIMTVKPRQHDRFVLIGLCWLCGRSEIPLPPHVLNI